MGADTKQRRPLDQSLERLDEALARSRSSQALVAQASSTVLAPQSTASTARHLSIPVLGLLLVVLLWLGATAGYFFFIPAVFAGLGLVALLTRRQAPPSRLLEASSNRPRVGMGAEVASDAVLREGSVVEMGASVGAGALLERGALVEMGASVGAGAVLERGAVVRMGASVGPRAVLEEGASVSWGASVGEDAVVGVGAVVAAGAEVAAGARVPPHTYLAPGMSLTAAASDARQLPAARIRAQGEIETASDPRVEQITQVCDRLEQEYARAPEPVQAMFGEARTTLASLRRTCLDLVGRERALRSEASPEALARLDQEKAAIEARLAVASDEQVRGSLSGAVTAIAAQQEQRKLLQNNADRLEAELTRLIWTVDGMSTELVRVRTAGVELYQGSTAEIARSVELLQDEINNIAQALEEANQGTN